MIAGIGTTEASTSTSSVTDIYEYDAFGNALITTGSTPNDYLYRGEQYDPDLGLYYLRARYYNPATGRFLSRDPLDGQLADSKSMHKYLYADGDPVNGVDPQGREDMFETDKRLEQDAAVASVQVREISIGITDLICVAVAALELKAEVTHKESGIPWPIDLHCLVRGVQNGADWVENLIAKYFTQPTEIIEAESADE